MKDIAKGSRRNFFSVVTMPRFLDETKIFHFIKSSNKALEGWHKQDITGNIDFNDLAYFFVFLILI